MLTFSMANSSMRDEPEHWRQRAKDARAAADRLDAPDAKRMLLEIAKAYEELASMAEKKQASASSDC